MKNAFRRNRIPVLLAILVLFAPGMEFAKASPMTPGSPAHTRGRFRICLQRAAIAIVQYSEGNYANKGVHPADLMQYFPEASRPAALATFALSTSPELFGAWQPKFHTLPGPETARMLMEAAQFFELRHHLRSSTLERLRLAEPEVKGDVDKTLQIIFRGQ